MDELTDGNVAVERAPAGPETATGLLWDERNAEELKKRWGVPAVHLLRSTGSTNDVARRLAARGAQTGTIVIADEQVAGRGRLGRTWISPPGVGLWCSMILGSPSTEELGTLPSRVALAIARAIDHWLDHPATIKWPNDVLVDGAKVGGILCEASWEGGAPRQVIAGIGLNLLQGREDFPAELRGLATSLRLESPRDVDRLEVAAAVIHEVRSLAEGAGASLEDQLSELEERDVTRGREIEVFEPETGRLLVAGRSEGVRGDGGLTVITAEGLTTVHSGTVRLSPAGSGGGATGKGWR